MFEDEAVESAQKLKLEENDTCGFPFFALYHFLL